MVESEPPPEGVALRGEESCSPAAPQPRMRAHASHARPMGAAALHACACVACQVGGSPKVAGPKLTLWVDPSTDRTG